MLICVEGGFDALDIRHNPQFLYDVNVSGGVGDFLFGKEGR